MRDENIYPLWNQIPLGPNLGSPLQVESPIVEPGLPGGAVELDAIFSHFFILEVDAVGKDFFTSFPVTLKAEIVVAGDDDLVWVGQCAEEIVEIPHVLQRPVAGQVAGRGSGCRRRVSRGTCGIRGCQQWR